MSKRSSRCTVSATSRSQSAGSETSALMNAARRPSPCSSAIRSVHSLRCATSLTATSAPRRASASAIPRPIERAPPAPVTSATLPSSSSAISDHDSQLAVDGPHLVGPQPDLLERHAVAGRDVKLERMPGTRDDLSLPDPRQLPIGVRAVVERARDAALTERSALVWAEVWQPVERAADVEHADLAVTHAYDS